MLTEVAEAMLARHELAPLLTLAPRWAASRFQRHHNLPGLTPKKMLIAIEPAHWTCWHFRQTHERLRYMPFSNRIGIARLIFRIQEQPREQ